MAEILMGENGTTEEKLFRIRNNYLELLQASLTGSIYRDASKAPFGPNSFDPHLREHGLDWPAQAQTMIGEKRLANLRALTESVITDNVPGDLIETGVWRGGACILMRAILFSYDITDRTVWVADSFAGLPPGKGEQYPEDADSDFHSYEQLAVPLEEVQENFRTYGLLDEKAQFLKGWFKDTLPGAPIDQLALMRLDGDMYESTIDALNNLYPKLSPHGYVIIDDYHVVPACKTAVHDFCRANGIAPEIVDIDGVGVYWRKSLTETVPDLGHTAPAQTDLLAETQITRLNDAFASLSKIVIAQLSQALTERDSELANVNQDLLARDAELAELQQSVATHNAELAKLSRILGIRNAELAGLNKTLSLKDVELANLSHALAARDAELSALYSSTTWKITKPIRFLKSMVVGRELKLDNAPLAKAATIQPAVDAIATLLNWENGSNFKINDVSFHLSYDTEELQTNGSAENYFLLGKSRQIVDKLVAIAQQHQIKRIFEMGILKGGSVVLCDLLFQPEKIVAIDHSAEPVEALACYIANHKKTDAIKPCFNINQANRLAMEELLNAEFANKNIDLIIDDASHFYEETKDAFNICFPYLKEGGLYMIEDWAWAHWTGDYWQKAGNTVLAKKTALSNLLIEIFMLAASRPDLIKNIYIDHNIVLIERGDGCLPDDKEFNIADHYLLRGKSFQAWL